jgi:hypothetical protein
MRTLSRSLIASLVACLFLPLVSHATPICDFDGDGLSELVIVTVNPRGLYDWTAFNPRSNSARIVAQDLGTISSRMIPGNWVTPNRAVAAVVESVGADPLDRATWAMKSLDYLGGVQVLRRLGRSGDLIIQGGDYDGNGITDSLILKRTTGMLGLRVNYFLSSYNGDNLGKERLYKALGAPFRDLNFFFSPDGTTDYLAVLQRGRAGNRALQLKPFTDTPVAFNVGPLPGGVMAPVALKQGTGRPDLLAFYAIRSGQTLVVVKNLSGREIAKALLPGIDTIVLGDFINDAGWEFGVSSGESVTIFNPMTRATQTFRRPPGALVSCVSNQTIQ